MVVKNDCNNKLYSLLKSTSPIIDQSKLINKKATLFYAEICCS